MAQLKKADIIKILVSEYGYEKEDLKFDSEGNPYTNAKLQALIQLEQNDAKEAELDSTRVQVKKSRLKDTDKIFMMNCRTGTVSYHSERTNKTWQYNKFGDQDTMEYAELITMNNNYPTYLQDGWLIVLDKEVQDELKLTDKYRNILTPDNADEIFDLSLEALERFVDALPEGQKASFVNIAQDKYEKDEIRQHQVVKFIENKFNFRFEDNAPLSDTVLTSEPQGIAKIIIVDKK